MNCWYVYLYRNYNSFLLILKHYRPYSVHLLPLTHWMSPFHSCRVLRPQVKYSSSGLWGLKCAKAISESPSQKSSWSLKTLEGSFEFEAAVEKE